MLSGCWGGIYLLLLLYFVFLYFVEVWYFFEVIVVEVCMWCFCVCVWWGEEWCFFLLFIFLWFLKVFFGLWLVSFFFFCGWWNLVGGWVLGMGGFFVVSVCCGLVVLVGVWCMFILVFVGFIFGFWCCRFFFW